MVGFDDSTFHADKANVKAGEWLARIHQGDDLSAQDELAFRSWLASDPAHAAAFEKATNIWDLLGAVPKDLYAPPKGAAVALSRRALLTGVAGMAVLGASTPFWGTAKAQAYRTAVGEQRKIALECGRELFLDTNTSLSVEQSGDGCLVNLAQGRVNCLAPGSGSFSVKTLGWLVTGGHSVFDVSNLDDCFSVVLIGGRAEVLGSAGAPIVLHQGDRAMAMRAKPIRRDRPDLSLLTAWNRGRLVFKDEPLADVVEQVNRYSTVKIEVGDANIASLHMSGGYVVGDTIGFAESLSQLLPLEVRRVKDKVVIMKRRDI